MKLLFLKKLSRLTVIFLFFFPHAGAVAASHPSCSQILAGLRSDSESRAVNRDSGSQLNTDLPLNGSYSKNAVQKMAQDLGLQVIIDDPVPRSKKKIAELEDFYGAK